MKNETALTPALPSRSKRIPVYTKAPVAPGPAKAYTVRFALAMGGSAFILGSFLIAVVGMSRGAVTPTPAPVAVEAPAPVVYGYNSSTDECTVPSGKFTEISKKYGSTSSIACKNFNKANALTVQQFAKKNIPNALENGKIYDFGVADLYDDYVVTEEEAKGALERASRPQSYVERAIAGFDSPEMEANKRSAETGKQCEAQFDGSVWCPK